MSKLSFATITVKYSEIAYHCWPDAPQHRAYLRSLHRHKFNVMVECLVAHNDRQIEFHDLQDAAIRVWPAATVQEVGIIETGHSVAAVTLGAMSCEMIAEHIGTELRRNGYNICSVSVAEEDDYIATVRWLSPPHEVGVRYNA